MIEQAAMPSMTTALWLHLPPTITAFAALLGSLAVWRRQGKGQAAAAEAASSQQNITLRVEGLVNGRLSEALRYIETLEAELKHLKGQSTP